MDTKGKIEEDFAKGIDISIHLINKKRFKIDFALKLMEQKNGRYRLYKNEDGINFSLSKSIKTIAIKNIVELAVPFKDLDLEAGDVINFLVEFKKENLELDRYPRYKYLTFRVPDENFEGIMWSA